MKKGRRSLSNYEELFLVFARRIDKVLISLAIISFILLFIGQLLLQNPYIRQVIVMVDQLEGSPFSFGK